MKQSLILSLDIGSSSVRAAVYDGRAKPIRDLSVSIKHSFENTSGGGSEMDVDECLARVISAIDNVLDNADRRNVEIKTVVMCAFWHSLVGVDARGEPTTKLLGWADTRSREYTPILQKRFDESVTHNRTGAMFHSSFWTSKLLWLRKESPDIFAKTDKWLSFSDYAALKLFGEATTSVSMASATGIFDQRKCGWDSELLRYLKISRVRLPSIISSDDTTFQLTAKFARRWPALMDANWFPAIGDGAADNLGSDCITKDKAALMVGTSAAMRVAYFGEPPGQIPPGLWCYRVDRKRVIVGGALSDGGNLYAFIKDRFKLRGDIDEQIMSRETADELVVIPFFHGERSTGYDENARGAIIGMTADHDGIDILRAAMEGVAFRLDDIYSRLSEIAEIDTIIASGGALRSSPVWTQIIANVLGHDLAVNDVAESSLRGAVLLALESIVTIRCSES